MKHESPKEFKAMSSIAEGLEILRQRGYSMFPPDDLGDSEQEKYTKAVDAVNRAAELQKLLGDDLSGENAARHFTDLARQLRESIKNKDKKTRSEIEKNIVRIASSFGLQENGLGNVLASAAYDRQEAFEFYEKEIKNGKLINEIQEAIKFIKK